LTYQFYMFSSNLHSIPYLSGSWRGGGETVDLNQTVNSNLSNVQWLLQLPYVYTWIKKKAIHSSDRASVRMPLIHCILTHHIHIHRCIACRLIIYFELLLLLLLPPYLYTYICVWFDIIHMQKEREGKWAHVKKKQVKLVVNKPICYVPP